MADDTDIDPSQLSAYSQGQIKAFQRQADVINSQRAAIAASDKPPGSASEFLGRESQPLAPVTYFSVPSANGPPIQGPMLIPRGARGIRGYPTAADESAIDNYNATTGKSVAASVNAPNGYPNLTGYSKSDQLSDDVNRVAGQYPSAPRFQMPSTDDMIDAGIAARRNQIQSRIDYLTQNPGSDQPVVIGGGRYPRYAPSQAARSQMEIRNLNAAAGELDRAQQANIANKSRLAIAQAKQNEAVAQDTARGQVVDFLSNIDESRYPHGSADREALIGRVFGSRPDWLHVMSKDKDLAKYVQGEVEAHTNVAQTMAALQQQYPGTKFTPSVTSTGKVSYRGSQTPETKEQDKLTALLHKTTGLTPEEFAAIDPNSVKAGGIFVAGTGDKPDNRSGTFHPGEGGFDGYGKPKGDFTNDYTFALSGKYKPGETKLTDEQIRNAKSQIESGGAIQIDTGKGYKAVIPRPLFQRFQTAFPEGTSGNKEVMSLDDYYNSLGLSK